MTNKLNQKLESNNNQKATVKDESLEGDQNIINKKREENLKLDTENFQDQIEVLNNLIIREKAENENLRKRFKKELEDAHKFAITNFVKNLVEQVENLFRATDNISTKFYEESHELKTLYEGVQITKKNLLKVFQDFNIKRIYPLNQIFNHQFHEAISQVTNDELESNTIISVIQAGYTINSRLIKAAAVIVSKKSEKKDLQNTD